MSHKPRLAAEARSLPVDERKRILLAIPEVELHAHLRELFCSLDAEYWVEVTHGTLEYGKDLVIVRHDPLSPDVIAVVVKKGDLKGKTSGDVDDVKKTVGGLLSGKGEKISAEIISQIEQAKDHEAVLKGHVKKLKVTKVLVVLAGELSNNARDRLEREVGLAGQVFDLAWLVQQFTEHYPQVFFEARAVNFLDSLVQKYELDSFYAKSGKTLSECFVEPMVEPLRRSISLNQGNSSLQLRQKKVRFTALKSVVAEKKHILLVGDPGSGKSKASAKLCIDSYRSALLKLSKAEAGGEAIPIPMMISARSLSDHDSAESLRASRIPAEVADRFVIDTLIVDGLDEVPSADREHILQKGLRFSEDLNGDLLVTSRKIAAFDTAPSDFELYELLPFEIGQAVNLVKKVLSNVAVLPALQEGIKKIQSQIPMNPLSLLLLVELVAERKEVPSSITELYDRYLDLVFGRWDQEKGVEVLFEYLVKKKFLASLAFHEFKSKDRLEIPKSEFDAFVSTYAKEYGWDEEKLRAFLKEIERAGVIEVYEEVFFRHRSFLDYFSALYIYEERATFPNLVSYLSDVYYDGVWGEISFFYAGLGRVLPEELLDLILARADGEPHQVLNKLLVGRLLQAGWHSPARVKERGIREVLTRVPPAFSFFHDYLEQTVPGSPLLYSDVMSYLLVEDSLGSIFLSAEIVKLLEELEKEKAATFDDFQKRLVLLWVSRRFMPGDIHAESIARFLREIREAKLSAIDEGRLLLIAGVAGSSAQGVLKAVGRRLRRITQNAPTALKRLLPRPSRGSRS